MRKKISEKAETECIWYDTIRYDAIWNVYKLQSTKTDRYSANLVHWGKDNTQLYFTMQKTTVHDQHEKAKGEDKENEENGKMLTLIGSSSKKWSGAYKPGSRSCVEDLQ